MGDIVKRPTPPPAPLPQPARESEALIPAAWRSARRNRHITVPLAVPPVLWAVAGALHAARWTPETAVASLATAGAVAYFAQHKWDRAAERWYAVASAGTAGVYLTAGAALGVTSGLPGEILGGALTAGAVAWGIPWWRHKRPRGRRRRERMIAGWAKWWDGHCGMWQLAGSRVTDANESGVTIRLRVQLVPGKQSKQNIESQVHLIESALQGIVEPGRIRVEGLKNPSQADLYFKRANPLAQPVDWDPAMAPRSVHEHAVDGMSETGQWVTTAMRLNAFVIGRTRSGKSNHLLVRVAALSGCADDRQVIIDLKGGRSGRPLIETAAVDYVITGIAEARTYLLMLVTEIGARAKYAYTGGEQLEATEEVPAIHTLIDEANGLTSIAAGDTECARLLAIIASQGSALEEYVEVYTQYGSLEESVRTEQTRSNLKIRAVYAVEEPRHGEFAIPEYRKHDASKLEEKGTHLLKTGPKAHAEQIRAPHMPHDLLREIAAENATRLAPRPGLVLYCGGMPCPAGGTWQEWWDTRWLRLDPAFRKISPQYAAAAAQFGDEAAQDDAPARSVTDPEASPAVIMGGSDARFVAARIERETQGPDFTPDRKTVAKVGDVMRRQKDNFAAALQDAPAAGISPKQLETESGMSSSWIYGRLSALVEHGAVTQVSRGRYTAAADIATALDEIESGNDALLRDARRTVKRLEKV